MGRSREQEKTYRLVSAYIDGELPPDDAQYVGRLIQEDASYAQAYADYRGLRMDLRALPMPPVPPQLSRDVHTRIAMMQPSRPRLNLGQRVARVTAAFATLAATLAAIFTGGFGLQSHFAHVAVGPGQPGITIPITGSATTATVLNTSIAFDQPAQIRFTRPMNEQTVKTSVLFTPTVGLANLTYDTSTFTLGTKPKTLQPNTLYRVEIPNGLKDAEGNEVTPSTFSFFVRGTTPDVAVAPSEPAATAAINPTPIRVAIAPTAAASAAPAATDAPATTDTPAATDQPAAPTDTPVVVKPTNTPVPPPKPAGTVIAVAQPTTPPPAPTATTAPTATVAPTATATAVPTVAPTPTTPAIAVADKFKGAYAATANRLGAATNGPVSVSTSQLFFQNGFMVYASGQPIYVFYTGDRTWAAYGNPGNSGTGSDGGPGPNGLFKPARAFGVVWTAQNLQGRLGYATAASESAGSGTIQTFEGGTILSVGGDVYVILKNGSWQNFSG